MIFRLDSSPFNVNPCCMKREYVIDLILFNGWAIAISLYEREVARKPINRRSDRLSLDQIIRSVGVDGCQ